MIGTPGRAHPPARADRERPSSYRRSPAPRAAQPQVCRSNSVGVALRASLVVIGGNKLQAGNLLDPFGILCAMNSASRMVGHRVLVDGMMGSGKSTFARALAARSGLPVIHLDVHYWKPGWVRPSDDEWREHQRALLAGEAWIIDGNYNETLPLRLERAETVIFLDSPWWLCASRAFVRGLRKPVGEMPEGCEDSVNRRLRDEWGGVGRIWRNRRSEPEYARSEILRHGSHTTVHVLRSRREAKAFLDAVCR
jgi:adenylate kinase family enzyme